MRKTDTLNLRVDPIVKQRAEEVLNSLGIPMSTAIDVYLNQISLTGGIPFSITLPKAPPQINADLMSNEAIHQALKEGLNDMDAGNVKDASSAFKRFRESR